MLDFGATADDDGRSATTVPARRVSGLLDEVGLLERDAHLARLAELCQQVSQGHGALALIVGAPGVGKTALLRVACAQAERMGMMALRGRCGEHEQGAPFGALRECFSEVLSDQSDPLLAGAAWHATLPLGLASADPAGEVFGRKLE